MKPMHYATHVVIPVLGLMNKPARSLFDTARQYRESFDAYGSKKSYEWSLIEGEKPVIHTAKKPEPEIPERVEVPDYGHLLPNEIAPFAQAGVYDVEDSAHLSFIQGARHSGSHPHLAYKFVASIVEDRKPYPNAVQSANWTMWGF